MTTKESNDRFVEVLEMALKYDLDRRMLVALADADEDEVRYEELRRAVEEPSSERFNRAFERLMKYALLNRRLEETEGGGAYRSWLSLTRSGKVLADALVSIGNLAAEAKDIPKEYRVHVRRVLLGEAHVGDPASDTTAATAP